MPGCEATNTTCSCIPSACFLHNIYPCTRLPWQAAVCTDPANKSAGIASMCQEALMEYQHCQNTICAFAKMAKPWAAACRLSRANR